ncbi:MAG: PHP domain-containing protein [Microgenomates group bacterium]
MNYVNFHSHSMFSNTSTPDCTITNEQRVNRCVELGMTVASSVEHGTQGRFIEVYELANKNGIKPLIGTEVYYVKNRLEKDRTNAHVIILAKNNEGRKEINWILSEANVSGYYYKPRIDQELLLSLNPKNVWVSTACVGGVWKYEDHEEIIKTWKNHFGDSLFLEVQNHNTDKQRELNREILKLSKTLGIKIIAGIDSHMIYPEQAKERDDYLLSRGIEYPDEAGWYLDFPSYETAKERFVKQGVLSEQKIVEALENTNVFNEVEEYVSIIFDKTKIKLPTIHPDKTQEERDAILWGILKQEWKKEKENVPVEKHKLYEEEIKKEFSVVKETGMSDYFLINHEVVKEGKAMGGSITLTSRGSAPSYYITKLLGITTIDRISAPVKLFPERFISKERLLETKSLPDVDFNLGTPKIFAEAQEKVLGVGHSYQMVAYGTVKNLGAWKLFARVAGVDFDTSNHISERLNEYEYDLKHIGEDEELSVYDYIEPEYHSVYDESRKYIGLVNTLTPHPCASLIFTHEDIRKEFGLIKIKTGNVEHLCVNIDGKLAEEYLLLKNDLLKVAVVDLIYRVYDRIGIKPHTFPELLKVCENDSEVWGIYERALGMGINQVEQPGTIGRVAKYKPKNISELSAFVAGIRPGFKSNYKQFESREPFSYGVKTIDDLIQTEEFPQSYMLYQENAMQIMAYSGIALSETYDVIKHIAKKRVEKVLKYKEIFVQNMTNKVMNIEGFPLEKSEQVANDIWQIIEDSSRYSFNASHALSVAGDSLYGAYLKAKHPYEFYEVFLQMLEDDGDKDRLAKTKEEAQEAFGITFPNYEFFQDNRSIVADKSKKIISSSLKSLKGFGAKIGEDLYNMSSWTFGGFVDFLVQAEENGMLSSKFEKLILIDYFKCFGKNKKLLTIWNEFQTGKFRYSKKLTEKSKEKRLVELYKLEAETPDEMISFSEQIAADLEIIGKISRVYPEVDKSICHVHDINDGQGKYAPRMSIRSLKTGKIVSVKMAKKMYENKPVSENNIIMVYEFEKKHAVKYNNGNYIEQPEFVYWIRNFEIVKNIDKLLA